MRYRYLDDFRRGISVFAIFSYCIAVLGTPQCPPPLARVFILRVAEFSLSSYRSSSTVCDTTSYIVYLSSFSW